MKGQQTLFILKTLLIFFFLQGISCGGGGGGIDDVIDALGNISLTAVADSSTKISLSWTAPSGGVSVSPYVVAYNDSNSTATINSTTRRVYEVAGLNPGISYCFVIKNPLTGSIMSNTACATTPVDNSPPSKPTGLTANAISPAQVDLAWDFANDDHHISGYNIYRDGIFLKFSSAIVASDEDAVANSFQCYSVTAIDPSGNESLLSNEACATTPQDTEIPSPPSQLSATFSGTNEQPQVTLSWTASIDDGKVDYYRIFREGVYLANTFETSYDDTDVQPDTGYCYQVSAVDTVGKESTQSETACARISWSSVRLDRQYVTSMAIAMDNADVPHIAYKLQEYDSSSGEYKVRLRYLMFQSEQEHDSSVLEEGIDTFNFSDAYKVAISVDNNNDVHMVHKVNSEFQPEEMQHLQISDSIVIDKNVVQQSSELMNSVALAVDSVGALHACYSLRDELFYATNSSGMWVTENTNSFIAGLTGTICDIALDNNDKIHISYTDAQTHDLKYLSNQSGSWSVSLLDTHSGTVVMTSHKTSIAIDSNNKVHIAYFHDANDNNLEYATNASGSWSTSILDDEGNVGFDCQIAIDSNDGLHIVYRDLTDAPLVKYAARQTISWEKGILAASGIGGTAIAIDSIDKVHITFIDTEGWITYLTNSSSF